MQKDMQKKTPFHRRVLLISCLIYISAVLFAIVVSIILTQPADAALQQATTHQRLISDLQTPIRLQRSRENYIIHPSSCQQNSQKLLIRHEPLTWEETVNGYVEDICEFYPNILPEVVEAIIWKESRYCPNVSNGRCVGLMQVSTRWHAQRAADLGVTDFYDPYSNILVGVDYLNDVMEDCGDISLALMLYNGDSRAYSLYNNGCTSSYAREIISRARELGGAL